jgi:hypothetical protein
MALEGSTQYKYQVLKVVYFTNYTITLKYYTFKLKKQELIIKTRKLILAR